MRVDRAVAFAGIVGVVEQRVDRLVALEVDGCGRPAPRDSCIQISGRDDSLKIASGVGSALSMQHSCAPRSDRR